MMKLGKLKEIDIRTVWPHEQYSFSKWLSDEENISQLGDLLGLELTDIETEKHIGSYRCDIFGKDEISGKSILIENQLEPTNHDHLGKIITYAAGLEASVIVWIVSEVKDEHVGAIEWLNKHTDTDLSFFLIEIHAFQIGDSDIAPHFRIIEQPNGFLKNSRKTSASELSAYQKQCYDFWDNFNQILKQKNEPFKARNPSGSHWYNIAVGSSNCHLSIDLMNKQHKIRIGLWIKDDKELFDKLLDQKEQIEEDFGQPLEWLRLDDKKASAICKYIDGLDFDNQNNYNNLISQTINDITLLKSIFVNYI